MAVVAYLRVSTEKQFLENQREEIIRFAERNGMSTLTGGIRKRSAEASAVKNVSCRGCWIRCVQATP